MDREGSQSDKATTESTNNLLGDVDEVHSLLQNTVRCMKQMETNFLRRISHETDDINDREVELSLQKEKLKQEQKSVEAKKKVVENFLTRCGDKAPKQIDVSVNLENNQTYLKDLKLKMNLENAMIGDGNTMNIGTHPEDIEDMKSRIAEILTKVQDGNMGKDAIIEHMKQMKKDLLEELDTLQATVKEARNTLMIK
ncbi:unnamed protein product [Mytilus coruscus]|uniref:Uncharacterized protein n=1 Tax=Mytilus coruscus TaxID=42192 RepID=A0A6J8CJK3_MYTCO|nr:unnamed protein product [Mytilus coruscus]